MDDLAGHADYWAASKAMPRIWGLRARAMTLRVAREIEGRVWFQIEPLNTLGSEANPRLPSRVSQNIVGTRGETDG